MAYVTETALGTWTAADLVRRFGAIPLSRVRHDPAPGLASECDVVAIRQREDRLYELVDGVLMEKTVGTYESYLAGLLVHLIWTFVKENDLGIVLGADGMLRLAPGLVRIPDVSFITWKRLPGRKIPRDPLADLASDLAVEVISKYNTPQEMQRKLVDYFAADVRQIWYVYPITREVRAYRTPDHYATLSEAEILEGGPVIPGFRLDLRRFFADPGS
jgi:Uma2 family endonuclease